MSTHEMRLAGKRIAALVTDGFEQVELTAPLTALKQSGAEVDIIVPEGKTARAWNHTDWGETVVASATLIDADPDSYAGLLLPGGVMSPDRLRMNDLAVAFVRAFTTSGKPIAAICHGPWTLINAGAVRGREMTSFPSLRVDLENAGARWVDREVVVDGMLITSRNPNDLPAFSRAMIDVFAGEAGGGQTSAAPNASFATGAGREAIGQDTAALAGNALGNSSYPDGNTYPQSDRAPRQKPKG
ncbi:type 1 glutamine amidotransferase [Chloroflexales bacterium ZM16-3]|nr:type 1 glutamine amidotransferase [Chloroflexales bacterium ZM16-3]